MRKGFCELCGPPRRAEFAVCRASAGGRRAERSLCETCTRNVERIIFGAGGLPLTDLLKVLILERPASGNEQNRTKVCPSCGNTADEVKEAGAVGCPTCYSVFRDEIGKVIRKLHGPPHEQKSS